MTGFSNRYACLTAKNIGKPCAGKPHARFDEGGQGETCSLLYPELPVPRITPRITPELRRTSFEGIAGELLEYAVLGLPLNESEDAAFIYSRINAQQIQTAIARWIRPADFVQVTRGPRPQ